MESKLATEGTENTEVKVKRKGNIACFLGVLCALCGSGLFQFSPFRMANGL